MCRLLAGPAGDSAAMRRVAKAFWIDVHEPTPEEQQTPSSRRSTSSWACRRSRRSFRSRARCGRPKATSRSRHCCSPGSDEHRPQLVTVAFIRGKGPLVTVTKGGPGGLGWLAKDCGDCVPPASTEAFPVLLDMIIEHATDVLDRVGGDLDRLNRALFQHHVRRASIVGGCKASPRRRNRQLERILIELGYCREVLVKLRRSVLSFHRVVTLLRERDATMVSPASSNRSSTNCGRWRKPRRICRRPPRSCWTARWASSAFCRAGPSTS